MLLRLEIGEEGGEAHGERLRFGRLLLRRSDKVSLDGEALLSLWQPLRLHFKSTSSAVPLTSRGSVIHLPASGVTPAPESKEGSPTKKKRTVLLF